MTRPDASLVGSPTERAHRHTIAIHLPQCDEMEMAARCDLAALRDAAQAGVSRAMPGAAAVLLEVSRCAGVAVYAPFPTSRLLRLLGSMKLLMLGAQDLDRASRDG